MGRVSLLVCLAGVVIVCLILGQHETEAARAVKKITTTTPAPLEYEDELVEEEPAPAVPTTTTPPPKRRTKTKKHSAKSSLVVKNETAEVAPVKEVVESPTPVSLLHPVYHYQQHAQQVRPPLPLTHSQSNWKLRLFKQIESQLPQIERDALDMAKGFLHGFGWKLQGWEIPFMESIVGTASRDMLSVFQILL